MSVVRIDRTGVLVIDGEKTFPIGLSNPPPPNGRASSGKAAWTELADAGATFVRTGGGEWSAAALDEQLGAETARLEAAARHGLRCWTYLGDVPDFGPPANEQLLTRIVNALEGAPALMAYKGIDEPHNPSRPARIPPARLVRAYEKLKRLDPNHPVVIVQAPRSTVAQLKPYRPAFDITGVDVFPFSYPPGVHTSSRNKEISVVGDWAKTLRAAAGPKPFWMTLQIAFSGTARSRRHPHVLPRFPTLKEERFMAYQSIVHGARGLVFFGGHLTQVCTPADAALGWNWSFWVRVLRPLLHELTSPELRPALLAPDVKPGLRTKPGYPNIELVTRRAGPFVYAIAVKRGGPTVQVEFAGVPKKRNGTPVKGGEVLFEYVQEPPPPPFQPAKQVPRTFAVTRGGFRDWMAPFDVRVYRFRI